MDACIIHACAWYAHGARTGCYQSWQAVCVQRLRKLTGSVLLAPSQTKGSIVCEEAAELSFRADGALKLGSLRAVRPSQFAGAKRPLTEQLRARLQN